MAGAQLVRLMQTGFTVTPDGLPADAVHAAMVIHGEQKVQEGEAMSQQ